jgi:aldose 1-epimerase
VEHAAQHYACCCGKASRAAAGQGVGDDEKHVHPGYCDDAEDQHEEDPEILRISHEVTKIERPTDRICQQAERIRNCRMCFIGAHAPYGVKFFFPILEYLLWAVDLTRKLGDIMRMTQLQLTSSAITATFSTLGARLVALEFEGVDVVRGGGSDLNLLTGDWTAGAVCGRHAGRITNASFVIDGVTHHVQPNMGAHQLHGGPDNLAVRHWHAEQIDNGMRFSITSSDGDQGFPGKVTATATYVLTGSVLSLELEARTSKPTVINLTNHAYWNLIGGKSAFEHEVQIEADQMVPLNELLLPSGALHDVSGTRWDFREMRLVAENYDNCWVLNGKRGQMKKGLTLRDPVSGRAMEVWTTEAGMQFYTAFHWNGVFPGKRGPLHQYEAIAIEPQNFPDACNHQEFPNSVLRPGEVYKNRMEWRFG